MDRCETCGNEYDRALHITLDGQTHRFDCFECAIHALAPSCEQCGIRILGHGVQAGAKYYCCAHCARQRGVEGVQDHV